MSHVSPHKHFLEYLANTVFHHSYFQKWALKSTHILSSFIVSLFRFVIFVTQDLHLLWSKLAWNWLYRWRWPWTPDPASTSQGLALQAWSTPPSFISIFRSLGLSDSQWGVSCVCLYNTEIKSLCKVVVFEGNHCRRSFVCYVVNSVVRCMYRMVLSWFLKWTDAFPSCVITFTHSQAK